MKIYKVFSRNRALELISLGNRNLYTEPNFKNPWLRVFCFQDTEKLHRDITMIDIRDKTL